MTSTFTDRTAAYKVIGTRPIRHDGVDKVTGRAKYGADINLPGLLHGKVLRSPHAHARIKSIDTSRAESHPDVKAVATSADLAPSPAVGKDVVPGQNTSDNVMARGKVLYRGHAVAAIAAASPDVAEEALSLIDVEYQVLPAVFDVEDAMKPGAPILHEGMKTASEPEAAPNGTNVADHEQYRLGDPEKGFAEADIVLEREYRTKTVHQGYIEPQNGTAWWAPDGQLTVWSSSQGHFGIREQLAKVLGTSVSTIKVVPMEIGGGFGGKLQAYLEPVAAVLSKKSGRPVKMTMSRIEVLEATGPTCGSYVRVKIGVTNDGRITGAQAYFAFEAGAFPGSPVGGAAAAIFAPYNIANVQLDGYDVVDNKPRTGAYRAPGAPIAALAVETLVDEIAERLGMDPIEFRLLNAAREGDRRADGVMNDRIGAVEVLEAVKSHPHYSVPLNGKNRGRGVALGFCRNNSGMSSVVVNVLADGKVSLVEGSVDIGGSRTVIAQHVAEVLGIPIEDVIPQVADTEMVGFTSITGGSGVAFKTGWTAYEAARDVAGQMVRRASRIWEVPEDQVEFQDGAVQHTTDPELRMTFKELAGMLGGTGGPIVGRASLNPPGSVGSYTANIVDLEVDPETGKVDLLRYTAFQDVGRAIHPSYVEGQIQGGTAQGIGWALTEEYVMSDDGHMMNSSFLDYRMPTSLDLPMIEPVIVEVPNPNHPFGVKGVGEANICPPLPAIANALYDAIGVRFHRLPMSPEAVVRALHEKNGG